MYLPCIYSLILPLRDFLVVGCAGSLVMAQVHRTYVVALPQKFWTELWNSLGWNRHLNIILFKLPLLCAGSPST